MITETPADTRTCSSCSPCVRLRVVGGAIIAGALIASVIGFLMPVSEEGAAERASTSSHGGASGESGHIRHSLVGAFSAKGPINVDRDGVAIHGYDPVAYFTKGEAMEGSEAHEAEYRAATFRFASEAHRELFVEDPESYLPAYGGYCALGVANGYKDGMHPEAFEIVDGRLFFNLTPAIHKSWQTRMQSLIEQGDRNWPELKNSDQIGPGMPSW